MTLIIFKKNIFNVSWFKSQLRFKLQILKINEYCALKFFKFHIFGQFCKISIKCKQLFHFYLKNVNEIFERARNADFPIWHKIIEGLRKSSFRFSAPHSYKIYWRKLAIVASIRWIPGRIRWVLTKSMHRPDIQGRHSQTPARPFGSGS